MKRLTQQEADEILDKFIKLRNKSRKSKSEKVQKEYKEYQEICASKFDYLIASRLKRYKQYSNYDDLYQDARIALLLALNSYDPDKGNFFWWAKQYIKTKISREANRHSTLKIPMKMAKDMQPYKVSEMPVLVDSSPDPFEMKTTKEIQEHVNEAINMLPEDQKKIVRLNGIQEHSISKISKDLKISRVTCIKLLNEAKKNLKQNLQHLNS